MKSNNKKIGAQLRLKKLRAAQKLQLHRTYLRTGLRGALIHFVTGASVTFNYAATLTFEPTKKLKYRQNCDGTKSKYYESTGISKNLALKRGRRFCSRFNEVMGFNNYRKKVPYDMAMQLAMFAVLEHGGVNGGWHYHIMFAEADLNKMLVAARLMDSWQNAGGGKIYDLQDIYDVHGWTDYITKEVSAGNTDAVDWDITHIY